MDLGRKRRPLGQQLCYSGLGPADDGSVASNHDRALHKCGPSNKQLDNCRGIVDVVVWIEFESLKYAVLADQVFDWILKDRHDVTEGGFVGSLFHVEHNVWIYIHGLGDRQGVLRRASIGVVIDGDRGHGRLLSLG